MNDVTVTQTTPAEYAKAARTLAAQYRPFGFNLVPLGANKRPVETGIGKNGAPQHFFWETWKTEHQTETRWKDIKRWDWWADVRGVGAVCGPVSGDLACIDFDTPKDRTDLLFPFYLLQSVLSDLGLLDSNWIVDSPRGGYHVWVRCPGLEMDKGKLDRHAKGLPEGYHIEIRWIGHYAALPGSQHPNGVYEWRGATPTEPPPIVTPDQLLAAYHAVTEEDQPKIQALPAKPSTNGNSTNGHHAGLVTGADRWAQAAFDSELATLRATSERRNDALNNAAFALGSIVAGGYLSESEVTQALTDAGHAIGLEPGEIAATIRSGLTSGAKTPRHPEPRYSTAGEFDAYEYGFVVETPDPADLGEAAAMEDPTARHHTWPYVVQGGRMLFLRVDERKDDIVTAPIADFIATIAEEIVDEAGAVNLVIEGQGLRRGPFRCEITGADFGSDAKLLAALTEATGGIDIVYNRMSAHLRPAIGKLTREGERPQRIRYYRTGWQDDACTSFLMPGMDETTLINVPRQIAYSAPPAGADLTAGLLALTHLIDAMKPELTAPIIAALFMPPMLRPAGLGNERAAVFIAGRTGSLKTSWAQTAMCLYGPGFISNDNLLKMGEGATRNAIMAFAAHAHDLPLLIDNYKPNTGNGKHDFVNLIHNILEGGDRKRSERSGALRDSKPIRCIPVVTGEDLPRDDAASIARILLVTFDWQRGEPNDHLTAAQELSEHLCAVGWTWITWLQSDAGRAALKAAAKTFPRLRTEWATRLARIEKDSANIARVASNLAVNQIAWNLAAEHPDIGPAIRSYSEAHAAGLRSIARTMAKSTVEALEAHQYRAAVRELLSSGQHKLLPRAIGNISDFDRDRALGWEDTEGVYLLPAIALAAVKRLLGPAQLLISPQTLYGQMDQLGWIADKGKGQTTSLKSIGGEKLRVLHLVPGFTDAKADEDGDSDEQIDGDSALAELGL